MSAIKAIDVDCGMPLIRLSAPVSGFIFGDDSNIFLANSDLEDLDLVVAKMVERFRPMFVPPMR